MNEFRARIGRVRMKAGGADVVVLDQERIVGNMPTEFMDHARFMALDSEPGSELAGYVIVALYSDGARNVGFDLTGDHKVPRELLPALFAELVRRKVLMQAEACEVINRANGFED